MALVEQCGHGSEALRQEQLGEHIQLAVSRAPSPQTRRHVAPFVAKENKYDILRTNDSASDRNYRVWEAGN